MKFITHLNNLDHKIRIDEKININLGKGSSIIESKIKGPCNINNYSFLNRCEVGNYFGLGSFSYIANTLVGNYCSFASRVSISAANHPTDLLTTHEVSYKNLKKIYGETLVSDQDSNLIQNKLQIKKTSIGNDVFIGDNTVVLRGRNIGDGAIVGAGAVVVNDIKPFAVVVGNPAKVLRYRFSDEVIKKLLFLKWWDLSISSLKGIDFKDIEKAIEKIHYIKSKNDNSRNSHKF